MSGEILGDGDPRADIIPIESGFEIEHAFGFFHQSVVDGDGGESGELTGDGGSEIGGVAQFRDEMSELGGLAGEFADDSGDGPNEHAGIPGKSALGEELFREVGAGFFAEAFDLVGFIDAVEPGDIGAFAAFDVAV